jgi:hypothetical protein
MQQISASLVFGILVTATALVYLVIAVWPVVLTVIPGGPQAGVGQTASLAAATGLPLFYVS